jgi:hypothetical protein
MNKIKITVRVNLIHSKLVFFFKKIIVHVNSNSASELHWFSGKKTLFTYEQCRVEEEKQPRATLNLTTF